MKKQSFFLLIGLFLICLISGCSSFDKSQKKPRVLVTISPYQTFVRLVARDLIEAKVAVPEDFNAHLFEPTPKQIKHFDKVDVWFQVGMPFEAQLEKLLKSVNPNIKIVDLTQGMHESSSHTYEFNPCSQSKHHHDHPDLHFWMSPPYALRQVEKISAVLSQTYPEYAKEFEENLERSVDGFIGLDEEISSIVSPLKNSAIITSHPSLTYFCKHYSLYQIAIECEGKSPLPKDIQKILEITKKHSPVCVFTQDQFDNKGSLAIAKLLKLPVYKINPHNPKYFEEMTKIADDLSKAHARLVDE